MLSVQGVSVTYPNGVVALQETTISIRKGELLVLLGPSGAGKSTLLRCLNGLVRPTHGQVRSDDLGPILQSARTLQRHRARTGMVFQQHHLIGTQTALRNVLMGRVARHGLLRTLIPLPRTDREIALHALDRVGLLDRALERADRLSGGQQQRVGIARAMAQTPDVILADEPVASLDPATAERVLGDLCRICREDGITAVVSLHQLELAKAFADRILGLSQGRVVFEGGPSDLNVAITNQIYRSTQAENRLAAE